jgi:hypothetical protein
MVIPFNTIVRTARRKWLSRAMKQNPAAVYHGQITGVGDPA